MPTKGMTAAIMPQKLVSSTAFLRLTTPTRLGYVTINIIFF